jgi:sugar lactone lactonase YvrE
MNRRFIAFLAGTLFIAACSKKNDTTITTGTGTTTPSVSTVAGTGLPSSADGTQTKAGFSFPAGICLSASGYLFVADKGNQLVRLISAGGVVNTVAGLAGTAGLSDNTDSVTFNAPNGVAATVGGTVFVADEGNSVIRAISTAGVTSVYAGKVTGALFQTTLSAPAGVATDLAGDLFIADAGTNTITKISGKGIVTLVAGSGIKGSTNGTGTAASFNQPNSLVVDGAGNIFVADEGNNVIRLINTQGQVSTFAGSGTAGNVNGKGTAASFNAPAGIAIDSQGNLYIADSKNNEIREISTSGMVTTLAGTGAAGAANGSLTSSTFNNPEGVAVDSYGNVYVSDTGNSLIRGIVQ